MDRKYIFAVKFCLLSLCLAPSVLLSTATAQSARFNSQLDFQLNDSDGKTHKLTDYADNDFLVVAFLGTECPLVKLYAKRLEDIRKEFKTKSVG
ncbi:MAG: redoxin domain-containing protein, partial [Planctomycetota bacterium]